MTTLRERISALQKRVASHCGSADGYYREVAFAQAAKARWDGFQSRVEALVEDFANAGEDADLVGLVTDDVTVFEEEVETYASEMRLFRAPRTPLTQDFPEGEEKEDFRVRRVAWRLGSLDLRHPKDWTAVEGVRALQDVLEVMAAYEKMIWNEVQRASKHNHPWTSVEDWERPSKARLVVLELDDQSGWYQFHLNNRGRLFGYRDGSVFNIVWWDRDHEVYKTKPG